MTWLTHTLFGISMLWLLAPLPPDIIGCDIGTLATMAALGALLPDLDAPESKIKYLKLPGTSFKPFYWPSQVVHRSAGRRGLLHSLAGLGMVTTMAMPGVWWVGWAPVVALVLGYASHLLADSATKSGLLLFYPRRGRFYLLPKNWRITTGSMTEEAMLLPLALVAMALLLSRLAFFPF